MAYVSNSRSAGFNLSERFSAALADFKAYRARRAAFWQTFTELDALSARELDDLGISRSDIARIAHEAAEDVK